MTQHLGVSAGDGQRPRSWRPGSEFSCGAGVEPRAWRVLGTCCPAELRPQSQRRALKGPQVSSPENPGTEQGHTRPGGLWSPAVRCPGGRPALQGGFLELASRSQPRAQSPLLSSQIPLLRHQVPDNSPQVKGSDPSAIPSSRWAAAPRRPGDSCLTEPTAAAGRPGGTWASRGGQARGPSGCRSASARRHPPRRCQSPDPVS